MDASKNNLFEHQSPIRRSMDASKNIGLGLQPFNLETSPRRKSHQPMTQKTLESGLNTISEAPEKNNKRDSKMFDKV